MPPVDPVPSVDQALADLIEAPASPRCDTGKYLALCPPERAEMLRVLLARPQDQTSNRAIWKALDGAVGYDSLRRHRIGECRCGK